VPVIDGADQVGAVNLGAREAVCGGRGIGSRTARGFV